MWCSVQVETFRVRKYSKFKEFRQLVAQQWGIPAEQQYWWPWEVRPNHTYRPGKGRFGRVEDEMFVCEIDGSNTNGTRQWPPRLNLFLQVSRAGSMPQCLTLISCPWCGLVRRLLLPSWGVVRFLFWSAKVRGFFAAAVIAKACLSKQNM